MLKFIIIGVTYSDTIQMHEDFIEAAFGSQSDTKVELRNCGRTHIIKRNMVNKI